MSEIDLEKARREELRWLILRTLYAAQPIGTSETLIRITVDPIVTGATELEVRNNLDYLAQRKLIKVEKNRPVWFSKIDRYGIDIVEYTVDCDPGIARPAKWC